MIPYLGCHTARGMLETFVDAELPVDEQVALDAHLRWCETCRARVEDLRLIGSALRVGPPGSTITAADVAALAAIQSGVLARIDAERDQSLAARCRAMCADTRFLWPALGATLALLLCVSAIAAVSGVVRSERPDSLAALVSGRASLPAPLVSGRASLPAPRPLLPEPPPLVAPEGEAVFLLSAVVSGGGRVATYELLRSAREPAAEVSALLVDALKDARFTPVAPAPAAQGDVVHMVWLLARTTVKASAGPVDKPLSGGRPAPRPARS
ncbi:MAG: zf-HC2 domain-containing protein [Acidobacteria bacterium]|nr:zf-HC2 domain-containing protein [Acidobacteriota bacterium]